MKNSILIPLLLVGGGIALYMYIKRKGGMGNKNPTEMEEKAIVGETTKVEKTFSPAFRMQYEVILPPVQASKAVKRAAYAMQDDRKAIELERMANKPEVYI